MKRFSGRWCVTFAIILAIAPGCNDDPAAPEVGTFTINPEPNSINAPWQIAGPDGYALAGAGDMTLANMYAGNYTLTWGGVAGWELPSPATLTQTLAASGTLAFVGSYSVAAGAVVIDIEPDSINATWLLTGPGGFTRQGIGDTTVGSLAGGSYTIAWDEVASYVLPSPATATQLLAPNGTLAFAGTYIPITGTVIIEPLPDGIAAPWHITGPYGFATDGTGAQTLPVLLIGAYTVEWGSVDGYEAPTVTSETLVAGLSLTLSGTYTSEPCSITNVSTGLQTSWLVGVDGPVNLRWDHTGPTATVKIELLKAGAVAEVVAASTANDGYYAWTPTTGGQPGGSDFGLRVTALGETGCAGEKTGLTLTDISGCTLAWTMSELGTIQAGDVLSLEWSGTAPGDLLDIEIWQDDLGGEPQLVGIVAADTPNDGQFTWDPVDSFHFGTDDWFYLRLSASLVPSCEAKVGPFRMIDDELCACRVTGFSAGSVFSEGQTMSLILEQDFGSGRVNLRLLAGAVPVPGGIIADNVPVNQVYNWVVNDFNYTGVDRTRFRIKATDAADGYCVGQSDVFTIQ